MRSARRFVGNRFAVMALLGLGLAAACSGDPKRRAQVLSEGCSVNSDCDDPLVCAFQKCHQACTETRDCDPGLRCVVSDRPFHVCQLESEKNCSYNSECPVGQLCGVDGECRDQCATDRDCVTQQVCVSGTCAEKTELTPSGQLPTQNTADAATGGTPCRYSTECPNPMLCRDGTCSYECLGDRDCTSGSLCVGNLCRPQQVTDAGVPQPDGATTCIYNSDCTPAVCRGGICVPECRSSVDCPTGMTCLAEKCQPIVIPPDGATTCTYNSDCSTGVCRSGVCVPECRANRDCAPGMACAGGSCVAVVPPDAPSGYGTTCNIPSDCAPPLICGSAGQCVYQCNANVDCSQGLCCFNHQCTTGPVCQTPDAGSVDAGGGGDAATGAPCVSNANCDDGVWCNGPERCYAGRCAPAIDTPCNSHSSCIQDTCTESTRACASTVLAPQDYDNDTHLDFACGGDDCNDQDNTIFTGAPELCDGKDNNCNGVNDDFSRVPHGPLLAGPVVNGGWCAGCGYVADVGGAGAPLGTGTVLFYGSRQYNFGGGLHAIYYDASGVSTQGLVKLFDTPNTTGSSTTVIDAAGGSSTMAVVYWKATTNYPTHVVVVDSSLAVVKQTVLLPTTTSSGNADIEWTGSQYAVAFSPWGSATVNVALVDTSGNIVGGAQPVPIPGASITGPVKVAVSGSTLGVAYVDPGPPAHPVLNILSSTGAPLVGPIVLPNALPGGTYVWGVAGAPGGYVVAYRDSVLGDALTYVKSDGTIVKTLKVPVQGVLSGSGATDGAGAAFAFRYADATRTVYARGALDSVEQRTAIAPSSPNSNWDINNISSFGGRLVAAHFSYNEYRMYGIEVGCP